MLLYTCPADRTARFSLITVVQTGTATAGTPALRLNSSTLQAIWLNAVLSGPFSGELLRGLVMRPGDTLYAVSATGTAMNVAGFGSLLDGPPT